MDLRFDAVVVGGGHAGSEAAHALAVQGFDTLLVCLNLDRIANLPCNPSIGGSAKGIVVREIDALGGIQGRIADACCIQMKVLNTSRGPGVQSLRAQVDKGLYPGAVREALEATPHLTMMQVQAVDLIQDEAGRIGGVVLEDGRRVLARAVVLSTGTHMEAVNLQGHTSVSAGPDGEPPSHGISAALERMGVALFRLKTGTPPRIRRSSIDFDKLSVQRGTPGFWAFSYDTTSMRPFEQQVDCYLTYTTPKTHEIIREHLTDSAMYGGLVKGIGPRYCPSIEDKIVRFASHPRHMLFVEPETERGESMYLQGFSTSMPKDVQEAMVHSLPGFEQAEFLKYAYAIEYDAIKPLQLTSALMLRSVPGLFCAGQICGTSGYEEAAALGLMAGINAGRYLRGEDSIILTRDQAYIGVMIDDLVTKGSDEPYRLLSSRAEYRLMTRSDNADDRLMKLGYQLGLNSKERYDAYLERKKRVAEAEAALNRTHVGLNAKVASYIESLGYPRPEGGLSMRELLKRKGVTYLGLSEACSDLPHLGDQLASKVEIEVKYEGYIAIQQREVARARAYDDLPLPDDIDYKKIEGLSLECREKLNRYRPRTVGEASRIVNVHPADIDLLIFYARKIWRS